MSDPAKHARILDAALSLFVDQGYEATTMPEIARLAGVAAGTLYLYFRNKEELVNSVWRQHKTQLGQMLMSAWQTETTYNQRLAHLYAAYLDYAFARPREFSFLNLHYHNSYLDDESRELDSEVDKFLSRVIREGQKQGVIVAGDAMLIISLIDGGVIGVFRTVRKGTLKWSKRTRSEAISLAMLQILRK